MDENKPVEKRYNKKKFIKVLLIISTLMIATGGSFYIWSKLGNSKPLDSNLLKKIDFVAYYPKILPENYYKAPGSERIENGVLFFDLSDGKKTVKISQQKAPVPPPSLDSILEFKKIQTISGRAIIGTQGLRAVGVLLTATTLISISGDEGVPEDIIAIVVQSMQYIP